MSLKLEHGKKEQVKKIGAKMSVWSGLKPPTYLNGSIIAQLRRQYKVRRSTKASGEKEKEVDQ